MPIEFILVNQTSSAYAHAAKLTSCQTDHCVDMLRENLMCTSDLSVVLFEYDDHHKLPQPDFSMTKKCRNFEAILEWNHKTDKRVEWDMLDIRRSQEGDDH